MTDAQRGRGQPFVNSVLEGWFWDNPSWHRAPRPDQPGGARVWLARSYAVRIADREVTASGGFSWGYGWRVGAPEPYPLAPRPLPRSAWAADGSSSARRPPDGASCPDADDGPVSSAGRAPRRPRQAGSHEHRASGAPAHASDM
jgi:hypothetical protein